jgi:hypothetical protein
MNFGAEASRKANGSLMPISTNKHDFTRGRTIRKKVRRATRARQTCFNVT